MPRFQYKAMDSAGQEQTSEMEAGSESEAMERLTSQGMTVLDISAAAGGGGAKSRDGLSAPETGPIDNTPIPMPVILNFYEQISFLIVAGIPIYLCVKMLMDNLKDKRLRSVLRKVMFDLAEGNPFSVALQRYPKAFPNLHCQLIAVGESTGQMDKVLSYVVDLAREQAEIRGRLGKAMAYPGFLLGMASTLVFAMIVLVFPKFNSIFESFKLKLPPMTQMFMDWGLYAQDNLMTLMGGMGLTGFALWYFFTSPGMGHSRDSLALSLPVVREVYLAHFVSLFTKNFGSLLKSGVPVVDALGICRNTVGGSGGIKREAISELIRSAREGVPLSKAMEKSPLFPELVWQLTSVGEEMGELGKMMDNIFNFYKKTYVETLTRITAVLQPVLMFSAAGAIAVVAASLFIPLFKLGTSIRRE